MNRRFHDVTAHYNAYYLSHESILKVEEKLKELHVEDYNRVLDVKYAIDTNNVSSYKETLEYAYEKAYLIVKKHKNSVWLDDAYILIGKCKLYAGQFTKAAQVFKYVNTKGRDKATKEQALILLMRAYIEGKQLLGAGSVQNYLKENPVAHKNRTEYNLTSAFFFQKTEQPAKVIEHLEAAVKTMRDKKERSRIHFILGQLYHDKNKLDLAYEHYKKSLKHHPPYDIWFFAKLNMSQVSTGTDPKEIKKLNKFFRKSLADIKNEEFRDRIFYDMAKFELKQGKVDDAIEHLNNSLEANQGNVLQKAYTYLELGKVYYEEKKEFEKSSAYYDSTITALPVEHKEYEHIKDRQETLQDFVFHLNTIRDQDSLQAMCGLDSAQIEAAIDKAIKDKIAFEKRQEELRKAAAEKAKKEKEAKRLASNTFVSGGVSSAFPFYDPASMTQAKTEFINKWGDRPLEDDWRRSEKESAADIDDQTAYDPQTTEFQESKQDSTAEVEAKEVSDIDRRAYYEALPCDDEKRMAESTEMIKDSYYNLGKIYSLKLEEPFNAIATFEKFLNRFPKEENEYYAESLYFLYLLCGKTQTCDPSKYKDQVKKDFPNSIYAKLIDNPNYMSEYKEANELARDAYSSAFELFRRGEYGKTKRAIENINKTYPNNDIGDKLYLLEIMTYPRTKGIKEYRGALQGFKNVYPTSDLVEYSNELIAQLDNYLVRNNLSSGIDSLSNVLITQSNVQLFDTNLTQPHYILTIYSDKRISVGEISAKFDILNSNFYKALNLKVENAEFDDNMHETLVVGIPSKEIAEEYFKRYKKEAFFKNYKNETIYSFPISEKNYERLKENKNIKSYLKFFYQNYLQE